MVRYSLLSLALACGAVVPAVEPPTGRSSFLAVDEELESFARDSEIGSELLHASALHSGAGDGALARYCAGKSDATLQREQRVEANWNGYGQFYRGRITKTHHDGTVDILYDDGFEEAKVKPENIKPGDSVLKVQNVRTDGACALTSTVVGLKDKIRKAHDEIKLWLMMKRAERAGKSIDLPLPPPPASGFATASANGTAASAEAGAAPGPAPGLAAAPGPGIAPLDPTSHELESLKTVLAAKDLRLKMLKETIAHNDGQIYGTAVDENADPSVLSIDDLILQIKAKIARRDEEIAFLEGKLKEQERYLRQSTVTLEDVEDRVEGIHVDMDEVEVKRQELIESDRLDPELRTAVDNVLTQGRKLAGKLRKLMAADAKAKEEQRLLEASGGSKDAKDEEEASDAEDEVLMAAQELQVEVEAAEKETRELDEDVVPGGKKWWRYRYQHSFVESLMMILISILMLLWERFYHYLRRMAYRTKTARGEEDAMISHGKILICWLEYFAAELMVCTLVFLTVWILIKAKVLHWLTFVLVENEAMCFPHSGEEYGDLAIDICVVFFWTIFFYFMVVMSVVHATNTKLKEWADFDYKNRMASDSFDRSNNSFAHTDSTPIAAMGGTFASDASEYLQMRKHLVEYADTHKGRLFDNNQLRMSAVSIDDGADFPFWKYLRLVVRSGVDVLFEFGITCWLMIIATFLVFMVLHYFLHMGYVRIMLFFSALLVVQLVGIFVLVRKARKSILQGTVEAGFLDSIHRKGNTELIVAHSLFYNLFILCYGAARIFFQPWMWELHFTVVAYLLLLTICIFVFFAFVIAPLLPVFMAVMALPPFMDPENERMLNMAFEDHMNPEEFLKN